MQPFAQPTFPGTSLVEAADVVAGETGDLRAIPLLPARGLRADHIASTCALLPDLNIEKGPRSWRVSNRPQLLSRRASDTFESDLDVLEEQWGTNVPVLMHAVGPYSLAVELESASGHRLIADPGAVRDLNAMLAEGIAAHVAHLQSRFHQPVAVHLYEPHLKAVIDGSVPGATQFDAIRAIPAPEVTVGLHGLVETLRSNVGDETERLRHIGIATDQFAPLQQVGADAVIFDFAQVRSNKALDECGQLLATGITPAFVLKQPQNSTMSPRDHAIALAKHFDQLALGRQVLATATTTVPGTTSISMLDHAHHLAHAVEVARMLREDAGDL